MPRKIDWQKENPNVFGPFDANRQERKLRITFHTQSLANMQDAELIKRDLLYGLASLSDVDSIHTDRILSYPYFEIEAFPNEEDGCDVIAHLHNSKIYTGIPGMKEMNRIAIGLISGEENISRSSVIDLLRYVDSHMAIHYDVFVTLDDFLLSKQNHGWLKRANIVDPTEALKILGLYLRANRIYTYSNTKREISSMSNGIYYQEALVFAKISNSLKFLYYCGYIERSHTEEKYRINNIADLSGSVHSRCRQALKALDQVGIGFYAMNISEYMDDIIYHFNYLTVLLLGALDSLSLICYFLYALEKPQPQYASFSHKDFLKHLKIKNQELHKLLVEESTFATLNLLRTVRHTIHRYNFSAVMSREDIFGFVQTKRSTPNLGRMTGDDRETLLLAIPEQYEEEILKSSDIRGGRVKWGISKVRNDVLLEPYTYAIALTADVFNLIESVIEKIDWSALGLTFPSLPTTEPKTEFMDKRLLLLSPW